ncbi:unnamed protein product [Pylaiella littoralis]
MGQGAAIAENQLLCRRIPLQCRVVWLRRRGSATVAEGLTVTDSWCGTGVNLVFYDFVNPGMNINCPLPFRGGLCFFVHLLLRSGDGIAPSPPIERIFFFSLQSDMLSYAKDVQRPPCPNGTFLSISF